MSLGSLVPLVCVAPFMCVPHMCTSWLKDMAAWDVVKVCECRGAGHTTRTAWRGRWRKPVPLACFQVLCHLFVFRMNFRGHFKNLRFHSFQIMILRCVCVWLIYKDFKNFNVWLIYKDSRIAMHQRWKGWWEEEGTTGQVWSQSTSSIWEDSWGKEQVLEGKQQSWKGTVLEIKNEEQNPGN